MMRSLFSGVAGLKTHQTKMDVIGNNIANVNTVGYKSATVTFSELMYQTTSSASGANAETGRGGTNAKQIGLGVATGAITNTVSTAGASQSTGNPFDIQISGDSFFIVSDGSDNYFTRAGAFYVDGSGNLAMTSTGYNVMGWQVDPQNENNIIKDTVSPLKIMAPDNLVSQPEQTQAAYLSGIIDKNSTQLSSDNGLIVNISAYDNMGYSYIIKASIKSVDGSGNPYPDGSYKIVPTEILDSEGNGLVEQSGKDTSMAQITVKLGNTTVTYSGGKITDDSATNATFLHYDTEKGTFLGFNDSSTKVTEADGLDPKAALGVTIENIDGFNELTGDGNHIDVTLNTSTMYDNKGTSTFKSTTGNLEGLYAGRKFGNLSGVAVQADGKIYGSYDNGETKLLGQIAVASFANPSGLEKVGESVYKSTLNSGQFDGIGEDPTSSGGALKTGVLEMSNVDLSTEFTEMITTQRGFQANSRIITVSDTLLEELTNLKR